MKFKIELQESFPPWRDFYVLFIKNDTEIERKIICAKLYCLYNQYILGDGGVTIYLNKKMSYYIIKDFIK